MLHDLHLGLPSPDLQADVIVVGAGAAGIALTVELARQGRRVLLLEAGGATAEPASQSLYQTDLGHLPHRGVHEGRFRLLGGTTTQWGGQILELEDADFAPLPWLPGSGWPFPKATLAPFYRRALATEGIAAALENDDAVWQRLKIQPPPLPDLHLYLSRWCPEPNFARLHHQALATNPNIQVWLHANAVELLFAGNHATGVRCRTLDGNAEAVFRAPHIVFALGAVETTRFFLQPREGALPWNPSGLLGCHFQDHIDSDAATLVPQSPGALHHLFDPIFLAGFKYNPKLRLTRAAQRQAQTLVAGGTVYAATAEDDPLPEVKATAKALLRGPRSALTPAAITGLLRHAPLVARQALRYTIQHRGYQPPGAQLRLRVHCEQEPLSQSHLTLSPMRDRLGLYRASLHWHISPLELRTIRTFVQTVQTALAPLATLVPHPDLADDTRFLAHCQDSFHHMGGMRMAATPTTGIVDPNLRLHNIANVYICSAATFPTSGFSNPTHTLLALTLRLADHLSTQPSRLTSQT